MPSAWRIVKARYAKSAFDGEGARLYGGRWNSPGVPMVYLAENRSLALLEVLVHLSDEAVSSFVLIEVEYRANDVEEIAPEALPRGWASSIARTRELVDAWVRSKRTPLLSVPSALVPQERNLLLDPRHPRARSLTLGKPEAIALDPRLARKP
jgi:RES domain-containing protein